MVGSMGRRFQHAFVGAAFAAAGMLSGMAADAAELKIWTASAIATILDRIGPQFEQTTGHKLDVIQGLPDQFTKSIDAGDRLDVLVQIPPYVDGLIREGKLVAETRTPLVRSGIGVEVRAGATKPDVSTVEAFKRTLLDAKSIAFLNAPGSGVYLAGLMERLGIADTIKSKVTRPDTGIVSELVAKGEIEIGMVVITQILTTPGVELVGPLPPEVQSYVMFVAAVSANSHAPEASRELIKFLTGPMAIPLIKSQGMEPL
jgi:molybdate transport system substrate-binding protein